MWRENAVDPTPKPEAPGPDAETLALFSPEQMQKYAERATMWMSGPEGVRDLEDYLQHSTLMLMQVTADVAAGRVALPGRSGMNIWARAIRDFPTLAQNVLNILAERETTSPEKK